MKLYIRKFTLIYLSMFATPRVDQRSLGFSTIKYTVSKENHTVISSVDVLNTLYVTFLTKGCNL